MFKLNDLSAPTPPLCVAFTVFALLADPVRPITANVLLEAPLCVIDNEFADPE
jgi:hypothetical protein